MPDFDGFGPAVVTGVGIDGYHEFPLGQRRLDLGEMGAKFQKIEAGRLAGAAPDGTIQLPGYLGELGELGDF